MAERQHKPWLGTVSKCGNENNSKGVNYWKFTLQGDGFGFIPCKVWGNTVDFEDGDLIKLTKFAPNSYSFVGQDGLKKYVVEMIIHEWIIISSANPQEARYVNVSQPVTTPQIRNDKVEWDDDGENVKPVEEVKPIAEATVNIDDSLAQFRANQLPTELDLRASNNGRMSPEELDRYIVYMKQLGKCQ